MDGSVQSFSARLRLLRSAERLQASKALTDIFAQISAAPAPRTAEETALQADAALQLGMLARSLREAARISASVTTGATGASVVRSAVTGDMAILCG